MTVSRSQPKGVEALAHYVEMRTKQPMHGLGCSVHSIHPGTEFAAEVTFFDLAEAVNSHATLKARIEDVRAGLQRIVDLKNPMPRAAVREAVAELLAALQPRAGS